MNININNKSNLPFVSICTPTFNRRPFIPIMLRCFEIQDYPKDLIEWIIIDDGTDKIEDLVNNVPQIKYFKYDEKMTLGKKRNLSHTKCKGDIIIYMDDDDYYPKERISHAVEILLQNPEVLCAGSSCMHIYFKHNNQMVQFGPYTDKHATAATFAFRKELLENTCFNENQCIAEERFFLKDYTIPFIQLDSMKTILVFSHIHNSFDKKILLKEGENNFMKTVSKTVEDFVKEPDIFQFFMKDIDELLENYKPGLPIFKPDVLKQIEEMQVKREEKMIEYQKVMNSEPYLELQNNLNQMSIFNNELSMENNILKDKICYLERKITQLIKDLIDLKKINKL
jgi:glycosyltransferase involved in cell wall biosynthesis